MACYTFKCILTFHWAAQPVGSFFACWVFPCFDQRSGFVAFLPGVLVMILIYLRTRRLAPLILAHWPMDILGAIMTGIR